MITPYTHTLRVSDLSITHLYENEVVILADKALESRGELNCWKELKLNHSNKVIIIRPRGFDSVEVSILGGDFKIISLRNNKELYQLFEAERFLFDITSLRHNIWAPILRYVKTNNIQCRLLYAEPGSYKKHPSPSSDTTFDLTTSFEGMLPLPSFSKIDGPDDDEKSIFVPLLGFEGSRPIRLLTEIEPEPRTIAIVGVPGFKIEYPTYTVTCNKRLFTDYNVGNEIRYARASCPFEAYQVLSQIKQDFPEHYMYIAPVGTKPHAVGAVMFAIDHPESTELLYDNPVGKSGRTEGRALIHIYDLNQNE
jgi:hypothetical protein